MIESLDESHLLVSAEDRLEALFWLHRFPVQLEQVLPEADLESVRPFVWGGLPLERLNAASFGIQLSANRRLDWSFQDLVETLIDDLGLPRESFQPRAPEVVLSAYFHVLDSRSRVFAGISRTRDNLSPWASGQCRIPRDPEAVSRAEAKLLEAWETFGLGQPRGKARALDLGAAPGGWSRVLLSKGYHRVDAVDPADLDSRVLELSGLHRHTETAGRFLEREASSRFDLIVSDMKMEVVRAADLLVGCANRLDPVKGRLLTTFKLGKGLSALAQAQQALVRLARGYQILEARQLYFNRSEITVLAKPLLA